MNAHATLHAVRGSCTLDSRLGLAPFSYCITDPRSAVLDVGTDLGLRVILHPPICEVINREIGYTCENPHISLTSWVFLECPEVC